MKERFPTSTKRVQSLTHTKTSAFSSLTTLQKEGKVISTLAFQLKSELKANQHLYIPRSVHTACWDSNFENACMIFAAAWLLSRTRQLAIVQKIFKGDRGEEILSIGHGRGEPSLFWFIINNAILLHSETKFLCNHWFAKL